MPITLLRRITPSSRRPRRSGGLRRACVRSLGLVLGVGVLAAWGVPTPATAQAAAAGGARAVAHTDSQTPTGDAGKRCPLGVVGRIEIRNHSLFSPGQIQGRPFAWALRLANWAHIRTRASYLRHELLLSRGDCYSPERLDESLRLIRNESFIARVQGQASELPDSTWLVQVETWDEWTTQPSVNFDVEDRVQFKGVTLTERDLLGRGLLASLRYHRFRERDDRSFMLGTPHFFGAHTNASVSAGITRTGKYFQEQITHPFVGELGRFSFDSHFGYEDYEYSYITGGLGGVSNILLPLRDRTVGLSAARRFGVPGALRMVGGEIDVLEREVSEPARQVVGGNFDGSTLAPDSLARMLGRQATPDSYVRIGAMAGVRRIHFTTRRGLDLVSGVQDVALGSELTLRLGRTVGTWHTSALDTYGSLSGFLAGTSGPFLGNISLNAKARRLDSAPTGTSRWRDLGLIGQAIGYYQPWSSGLETLQGRILFNGGWHSDQPYQLGLGGQDHVRGYRDLQIPESTILVGSLEERLNLAWLRPAVDLGLTFFGDTGMGWADGVPFARDSGWLSSLGTGIRVGFPAGTGQVGRIELAWPVSGPNVGHGPVFRVYWSEIWTNR